jgi:hypothetical protein
MASVGPAALVVAHPGHELRLFGWMTRTRPIVHVLTDGSGAAGRSRLASTTRVLAAAGATPGAVYGPLTDAALYAAVVTGRVEAFLPLVAAIAESLETADVRLVVADAVEGYNPAHDLASVVAAAAVGRVARRGGRAPARFEYPVVGSPPDPAARPDAVRVDLAPETLRRKIEAALSYGELRAEVADALSGTEASLAGVEWLVPVDVASEPGAPPEDPPFYERHGERRVREGRYADVLRYRRHLRPFARALVERAAEAAA